ncbi:MAG: NUDIX domain-containing protein [Deltaproteobacteria bacterium]|nr:NUDIX domain-containing protein [Deltaproteobacteria bacterium]
MERLRVVTVFLARGDRLLGLLRSSAVATYRGRWAGVSGAIEAGENPLDAVFREVFEETGVAPSDVIVIRAGLPVDVDDATGKRPRCFRVYPFLLALRDGVAIRLNPEHVAMRWVTSDEVILMTASQETVPELDEALARVWDPPSALPPQYRGEARAIFEDRTSGATELARRAAALVSAGAPPERVAALRPTMAAVVNAARAAAQPGRDVASEIASSTLRAAAVARAWLKAGMRVGTFSRSSTVLAALEGAPRVTLLVGVSLPGGEGAETARAASALGHEVVLLSDEELADRVERHEVDLVLVGADAVLRHGGVINKVGTRALAEAAARAEPPVDVVVACDEWKQWDDVHPPPLEELFEAVPGRLIVRYSSNMKG